MWNAIGDYFGIVEDADDVICYMCVRIFTICMIIYGILAVILLLLLIVFYIHKKKKLHVGVAAVLFCTVLGIFGIVITTTEQIWFHDNSNILERFESSSEKHFLKQAYNSENRPTWDDYETKLGCCGVHDYKDYYRIFHSSSVPVSCYITPLYHPLLTV